MSVFLWAVSGAAIATTVVLALRWLNNYQKYSSLRSLPSPSGYWLLGNLPQLLAAAKRGKYFELLSDWAKDIGGIYVFWIAGRPTVILSKPKVIEKTIVCGLKDKTLIRDPQQRELWFELFGAETIIQQDENEWQWRRQTFNKTLTVSHLNAYLEIICQGCDRVVNNLKNKASRQETVEVDPLFAELIWKLN